MQSEDTKKILLERTFNKDGKILRWLKNPYNLALIGILVLALVVRLYLNNLGQAVWWDEAEYVLQAKHWALGTPSTGWNLVRPVLFSFVAAIFYKIGFGELFFRLGIIGFSLLGILMVYLFGKKFFGNKAAVIGSFLYSFFYLDLFLSGRFLVGMPSLSLGALGMFLFWKGYYGKKSVKLMVWAGIVLALTILLRYTGALFSFILVLYLILTEGLKFLKKKKIWIAGLAGFCAFIPYFIWSLIKYGNPVASFVYTSVGGLSESTLTMGWTQFFQYLGGLPNELSLVLFIVFICALLLFLFKFVIGFDLFLKGREKHVNKYLFLILWGLFTIIYHGFYFLLYEPRYIFYFFMPAFIMIGGFLSEFIMWFKKNYKLIAIVVVLVIMIFGVVSQFKMGKSLIDAKKDTYIDLKLAGFWIKEHSEPGDLIISNGVPQNTYYAERKTETVYTKDENEFLNEMKERNPKYFVLSIWERGEMWLYSMPQAHPDVLIPVQSFGVYEIQGKQIPGAVIYEFKFS